MQRRSRYDITRTMRHGGNIGKAGPGEIACDGDDPACFRFGLPGENNVDRFVVDRFVVDRFVWARDHAVAQAVSA